MWGCYADSIFIISVLTLFQISWENLINFVLILLAVMSWAETFIENKYYEKVVDQKDKKDT